MAHKKRVTQAGNKNSRREHRLARAGVQKLVRVTPLKTKLVKVTPLETKLVKVTQPETELVMMTRSASKRANVTQAETKHISVNTLVMRVFSASDVQEVTEKCVHHFSATVTPFPLSYALETTVDDASESVVSSESVDVTVEDASESVDDSEAGSWVFCSESIAEWDEAIQAHVLCDGMPCPFAW
jgi:hypothetical protein